MPITRDEINQLVTRGDLIEFVNMVERMMDKKLREFFQKLRMMELNVQEDHEGVRCVSVEYVADLLGVHPDTIRKKCQRREIPARQEGKGKKWYIPVTWLYDRMALPGEDEGTVEQRKAG